MKKQGNHFGHVNVKDEDADDRHGNEESTKTMQSKWKNWYAELIFVLSVMPTSKCSLIKENKNMKLLIYYISCSIFIQYTLRILQFQCDNFWL